MICTKRDDFIIDYQEQLPSWIVTLNSGVTVYQDDGRPGIEPHSAWERLYNHCQETNDYIVSMTIKFRSNMHQLSSNADGYYFSKGARAGFAFPTMQLFFVGTLQNNRLIVTCWKTPEMLKEESEERNPNEAGICLIKRSINLALAQHD